MTSNASQSPQCAYWDNSECEGTPLCPPRCPRFVDTEGTPILIRSYEDDDFEAVVMRYRKLDSASRTMGLPPSNDDQLRNWIRTLADEGWNMVALHNDEVVGHIGVSSVTASAPDFVIFVLDEYQNRGIGTELLEHVIASAPTFSHEALTLDVLRKNRPAITVYQNIGFEVTDTQAAELRMRLSLEHSVVERAQRPPAEQ